jgi:hypothetical protein
MRKKKQKEAPSGPSYREILLELLELRENDYDGFMHKLYDALSGDFRDMVHDDSPLDEKLKALSTMIEYFAEREEYEKCAELKKMSDQLNLA